jgi:hypothetical protein
MLLYGTIITVEICVMLLYATIITVEFCVMLLYGTIITVEICVAHPHISDLCYFMESLLLSC